MLKGGAAAAASTPRRLREEPIAINLYIIQLLNLLNPSCNDGVCIRTALRRPLLSPSPPPLALQSGWVQIVWPSQISKECYERFCLFVYLFVFLPSLLPSSCCLNSTRPFHPFISILMTREGFKINLNIWIKERVLGMYTEWFFCV